MSAATDTVISVQNLGKRYRLGRRDPKQTLVGTVKSLLLYPINNFRRLAERKSFRGEEDDSILWALKDVNFAVQRGEVLGIVGHNGAGKSSVLKILSRITPPTTGRVEIKGRVASLLEVGTGFHTELSGRDNVYMNGTVLGMSRREITEKFAEIVAFSGVEKHIDTPIKFYSSGMKVRLAFSVAAHLNPEIMIIDEVLAVGDLAFQQKCLGKMEDVAKSGRTVLFVSHNMAAVEALCSRCIMLEHGRITYDGTVPEAIHRYRQASLTQARSGSLATRTDRTGSGRIRVSAIRFNDGRDVVAHGPLTVELQLESELHAGDLLVVVKFCRNYQDVVMLADNVLQNRPLTVVPGTNKVRLTFDRLRLMPGDYLIDLYVGTTKTPQDKLSNAGLLSVRERDVYDSGITPDPGKDGYYIPDACGWSATPVSPAPAPQAP